MARRRAIAIAVPQTEEEAIELLGAYVAAEHEHLRETIVAEAAIDAIKLKRDQTAALRGAEQNGRFAALKAWWEAGGKEKAGKARSTELAGAKIGFRVSPAAVKFIKGFSGAKVLEWLSGSNWERRGEFVRTKDELDKAAIIKAAQAEEEVATTFAPVLRVARSDEFFIDAGLDADVIRAELAAS